MATTLKIEAVPTQKKKVVQSVEMANARLITHFMPARCSQTEHLFNVWIICQEHDDVMDAFPIGTFHTRTFVPIHSEDVKTVLWYTMRQSHVSLKRAQ